MSVLTFDKKELGNLEYSLQREMLATDRRGGYMSTTIVCCNTRKYHGLMVAPIDDSDRAYVLLSSVDETVVHDGQSFNLALHRFPGTYEPRGHKYITDFEYTPTPTITYRVGSIVLRKELLWIHNRTQLMIRYTLLEAPSDVRLRLRPFFAFRDKHALTHANMEADGRSRPIPGGVKCRLYSDFPWLYLQTDCRDAEFVPAPDWYYNFEYAREIERGYEGDEDLLTTGYFELSLGRRQSVIFSASVEAIPDPAAIGGMFAEALSARSRKVDFLSCLRHSARQFVVRRRDGRAEVLAGYPWYGQIGRQTLVALPGIALEQGRTEDCLDVLDTVVRGRRDGMFTGSFSAAEAADAPLWFFWVLQQLQRTLGEEEIWKRYGIVMKELLAAYRRGVGGVAVHDNGLVWASAPGKALTWMNALAGGVPVVSRDGYPVEINALWYNAVCYALELASRFGEEEFVGEWKAWPERIRNAFREMFWSGDDGYLADFVGPEGPNRWIRPNMVVACGLDYKMLDEEQQASVLRIVGQHLLTPKGLRSLSPRNPRYKNRCEGDEAVRAEASMNGSVWVWLLWFYVKASFDLGGREFLPRAELSETSLVVRPFHPDEIRAVRARHTCPIVFVALGMSAQFTQPVSVEGVEAHFYVTEGVPLTGSNVTVIPYSTLHTQDYVAAADYVVTKAGWGTVAECLLAQKPMALFARDSVLEDRTTIRKLEQKKLGIKVTYEQLTEMSDLLEQMKQITYPAVPEYHNAAAEIVSKLLTLTE